MTALTGETGAGKTMLVEALELLVGGRADPLLVRPGAERRRGRGPLRARRRGGRAHPGRPGRRSLARLRRRPDGHCRRAGRGRRAGRRPPRPARPPVAARRGRAARRARPLRRHRPRAAARRTRAEVDSIGAAPGGPRWRRRARAREVDLLRFQVDELERGRAASARRGRAPRRRGGPSWPTPAPTVPRPAVPRPRCPPRAARATASAAALAELSGRAPFVEER